MGQSVLAHTFHPTESRTLWVSKCWHESWIWR